ncbi:hypothetical protein ACIHFE_11720 [Streptomyces sp. NPDC052396]|uniref:hypothetical protein n=1 Tax=Streptomyces sp. NPDC052396 TaxID=3365689 RepID=UPI0037CE9756
MRIRTLTALALATGTLATAGLFGAPGAQAMPWDTTVQDCMDGGGYPDVSDDADLDSPDLPWVCVGGTYDGRPVSDLGGSGRA